MITGRCKISLLVFECSRIFNEPEAQRTNEIFFNTTIKRKFVSPSGHECSIYYINSKEIPNRLAFAAKAVIYCVTITTVIFSCVKITCYFTHEDIMFSREGLTGISLVFI